MSAVTTDPGQGRSLPGAGAPAGFAGVVGAEWTKLRSVRSTYWSLLAAVVLVVGLGAAISAAVASHYSRISQARAATFDPTTVSLAGLNVGVLAVAVLGVIVVTSEYSTGMIRTTLTACPRRHRVLAAKAAVFAAVALLVGEVSSFAAFLVGQAILSGSAPHATLSQPGVARAVVGAGLYTTVIGLLALGVGSLLRHTAGAITTIVAVVFALPGIAAALPSGWGTTVREYLPSDAGSQVFAVVRGANSLPAWTGFAVLCGYTAVVLASAFVLLNRRDA